MGHPPPSPSALCLQYQDGTWEIRPSSFRVRYWPQRFNHLITQVTGTNRQPAQKQPSLMPVPISSSFITKLVKSSLKPTLTALEPSQITDSAISSSLYLPRHHRIPIQKEPRQVG